MINCPVCETELNTVNVKEQIIEICPEHCGVWFRRDVLEILLTDFEEPEEIPESLQSVNNTEYDGLNDSVRRSGIRCPVCNIPADILNFSKDTHVVIDRCPECRGIWLDNGELEDIIKSGKTRPELNEALRNYFLDKYQRRSPWIRLIYSRPISGFIGLIYLVLILISGSPELIFKGSAALFFVLACIWFSSDMGSYVGSTWPGRPAITKKTPGIFIALAGWFFLLIPLIFTIFLFVKDFFERFVH